MKNDADHQVRFLVIDVGTSSLKAAVVTGAGDVLTSLRRSLMRPSESSRDFSGERWLQALGEVVPRLVLQHRVDAVVLSGNGPTLVAVDADGAIVGNPLLWMDGRSEALEGSRSFYLPKIAWFSRRHPEAHRVRWYIPFPEFLLLYLTGNAVAITPSEEFEPYIWTRDDAERAGIDPALLPPFVRIGSQVGEVRATAASELGIPRGTPVVAAGSDFLMSLVGTNVLRPGETCDRAGTSEGINYCAVTPVQASELRTLPHVIPGRYNVAGILSSTGLLFEWFREISGQQNRDYEDMMADIVRIGDDTDMPWFFPSLHRQGSWEFRSGMFIGLGARHSRAEMGRAVVLSIGFAVRETLQELRSAGCPVTSLTACGGQARNRIWTQMKADICGVPIHIPAVTDAELIGNVCCGLVALGRVDSLRDAADRVVHLVHTFEPEVSRMERYSEEYGRYQERLRRFQAVLEEG